MRKEAPYVVFGSGEISWKGLLCYPSERADGWAAKIVQLADATQAKPGTETQREIYDGNKNG